MLELLQALLCECRPSDAEFLYDLGKLRHVASHGNQKAQRAFDQMKESVDARKLTEKFLADCELADQFYQGDVGMQFCALVEDWSRIRIVGELQRRKQNGNA